MSRPISDVEVGADVEIEGDVIVVVLMVCRICAQTFLSFVCGCLINANKHAQAREIVIAVGGWRKGIVLSVTDDGVGFQNELNSTSGLGLSIMKYRARSIGGRLEIESSKKGGTRVACYFPGHLTQSNR